MAARKPVRSKVMWGPDVVRQRIKTALIVRALSDHVLNGTEMAPSRVTAGLGLLKKVVPDLSAIEHKDSQELHASDLSTDELARRISALEGAISTQTSQSEPTELH